jgi:hypothetical protein
MQHGSELHHNCDMNGAAAAAHGTHVIASVFSPAQMRCPQGFPHVLVLENEPAGNDRQGKEKEEEREDGHCGIY